VYRSSMSPWPSWLCRVSLHMLLCHMSPSHFKAARNMTMRRTKFDEITTCNPKDQALGPLRWKANIPKQLELVNTALQGVLQRHKRAKSRLSWNRLRCSSTITRRTKWQVQVSHRNRRTKKTHLSDCSTTDSQNTCRCMKNWATHH
jgi:hypothetical protein